MLTTLLIIAGKKSCICSIIGFTYRSFNVDDLFINTIASGVGFICFTSLFAYILHVLLTKYKRQYYYPKNYRKVPYVEFGTTMRSNCNYNIKV